MIVKTFTGPSVRETLQMVRDAFGADAVILETRMDDGGGRKLGIPKGGVLITAAAEPQRPQESKPPALPVSEGPRSLHLKGDLGDTVVTPAALAFETESPKSNPAAIESAAVQSFDRFEPILRELNGISQTLRAASSDESLWNAMQRWLSSQPSLSAGILEAFAAYLVEALPPHHGFLNTPAASQTTLVVGGRGVGKSTFLFKALAARWQSIQRKPNLAILSVSPEHGQERLQALSVGCGVEFSARSLGQTRRLHIESDGSDNTFAEYIGGRVTDDCEAHAKLIRKGLKPDVVALVLNATSAPAIWRQQLNRLALLAPTHLVFTHWDEAQPWWDAINFSGQSRLPLAYRVSGFEAFGEIDPFTPTEIQSGITDHMTRTLGSTDNGTVRKEVA